MLSEALHVHQCNILIHIYIQFHEIWFTDTLIMAKSQILNQFKGNNLCTIDAILKKLEVHHHIMMIHI